MSYWDSPPMDREQMVLFAPALEASISGDHPVRVLDEVARVLDWSGWESGYCGVAGRPAIHPRVMASLILYGLTLGNPLPRGSSKTPVSTGWTLSGWPRGGRSTRTFAKFRTEFGVQSGPCSARR